MQSQTWLRSTTARPRCKRQDLEKPLEAGRGHLPSPLKGCALRSLQGPSPGPVGQRGPEHSERLGARRVWSLLASPLSGSSCELHSEPPGTGGHMWVTLMHVHGKVLELLMEERRPSSQDGENRWPRAAGRCHAAASGQMGCTGLAGLAPRGWELGVKSQPGFAWAYCLWGRRDGETVVSLGKPMLGFSQSKQWKRGSKGSLTGVAENPNWAPCELLSTAQLRAAPTPRHRPGFSFRCSSPSSGRALACAVLGHRGHPIS